MQEAFLILLVFSQVSKKQQTKVHFNYQGLTDSD